MKKKGIWGVLIIGAVAAVSLVVLLLVSPSCAGAESGDEPAGLEPLPTPEPVVDPAVAAAEAAAEASVAATVAASTALTAGDVARRVDSVLATKDAGTAADEGRRSRVFARTPLPPGASGPAGVSGSSAPAGGGFGVAPVFGDGWEGASGALELYEDRVSFYGVLRPEFWTSYPLDRGSRFAEPDGLGWMRVGWSGMSAGDTLSSLVAARRASLDRAASDWRLYEFFEESAIVSEGGIAGIRLDYGRRVGGGGCTERVSEAWYGPLTPAGGEPRMYEVVFAYCAGSAMELGGYAGAVLAGFRWMP